MTNPNEQQQFKSASSGRLVVPGWTNLVPDKADVVEVQFDLAKDDYSRSQALLLIEYWANNDEIALQSILPVRAFANTPDGWCVFVPAQGRLLVRAIDPEPSPPLLASHWINIDPQTPMGTVANVAVNFPNPNTAQNENLQLNN